MEFKSKIYKEGDIRIKTWFALFPVTVYYKDYKVTRWFKKVTVTQKLVVKNIDYFNYIEWENLHFIDDMECVK